MHSEGPGKRAVLCAIEKGKTLHSSCPSDQGGEFLPDCKYTSYFAVSQNRSAQSSWRTLSVLLMSVVLDRVNPEMGSLYQIRIVGTSENYVAAPADGTFVLEQLCHWIILLYGWDRGLWSSPHMTGSGGVDVWSIFYYVTVYYLVQLDSAMQRDGDNRC